MSAFILLAVMVAAMAIATFIPGGEAVYSSPLFIAGWGAVALISLTVMIRRRLYRKPALFLLHLAFVVILGGALVTHLWGESRIMHLRVGQTDFAGKMPVTLTDFAVKYYPGTSAPADFVSTLEIDGECHEVAMNRVASVKGWRFYQTSYDSDHGGSVLTITHDPVGIAVTYTGYAMLLCGMALSLFKRRKRRKAATICLLAAAFASQAAEPRTLPADVAKHFGTLSVESNGRVTALSSLAGDFTRKLTGSDSYHGLTPEQVITGWLFYYDDWKSEPCLKIKDKRTRKALGISGNYASLTDFMDPIGGYKLNDATHPAANEQFSLASMAATGALWRIFPVAASDGATTWFAPIDALPDTLQVSDWTLIRHSLNYLAELAAVGNNAEMDSVVTRLARYQMQHAGTTLPSSAQILAEKWYTWAGSLIAAPLLLLATGLICFFSHGLRRTELTIACTGLAWITSLLVADNIATGRLPMANGPETMQLLAAGVIVIALTLGRHHRQLIALGMIAGSLALMVACMGLRTPQLGPLMPVLRSPLLSIHVVCVMLAYALLALIALSCTATLCGRASLLQVARTLLRPAVYLLAAGIFIGAVWANMSWGRYWGWDPKEVWALITMLVYCAPLHSGLLPRFRSPRFFALYCAVAFLSVLVTYFGVNFLLGGLHSYA